jgi:hypothetical protein
MARPALLMRMSRESTRSRAAPICAWLVTSSVRCVTRPCGWANGLLHTLGSASPQGFLDQRLPDAAIGPSNQTALPAIVMYTLPHETGTLRVPLEARADCCAEPGALVSQRESV